MKIYIELLIIIIPIIIFIIWSLWKLITDKLNKRKYNPENDKGRKAEESREHGRREQALKTTDSDSDGYSELEEPRVLQTTEISVIREDNNSTRKSKPRNIFRKR